MPSERRECDGDVTVVSSPKGTLCNCIRVAAVSSTVTSVENQQIASHSSESTIHDVGAPMSRAGSEDRFDNLADKPVLKERHTLRTRLTPFCSSAGLEDTVGDQIKCIPTVVEDAAVQHFSNAGLQMELSAYTKAMAVIQSVADR